MCIQNLLIQGYRSFRETTWCPGKLNLLVGPNASGKSNLLRLLELISAVARGQLKSELTRGEGILPLLWNHEATRFGWKLRMDPVDEGRDPLRDALDFQLTIQQAGKGADYQIVKDNLGSWYDYEHGTEPDPSWVFKRASRKAKVAVEDESYLKKIENSTVFKDFDKEESLLGQIDARTNRIPSHTKRVLEAWRIHHDVHVEQGSPMRLPAVTQHSTDVESDGYNLTPVLHTLYSGHREFKRQIDEGITAAFGSEYEELKFLPAAKQQIQLAIQWKSSRDPHAGQELSEGTLRYLFLLTVLANPEPPPLLAIDEPEVGLHPSMMPLIAEFAIAASERTQLIISTHSPEFLDAFSEASPTITVCHWSDGESRLYTLPADSLTDWLSAYRLGKLFTGSELDALAQPDVEEIDDIEQRFADLPSEDAPV